VRVRQTTNPRRQNAMKKKLSAKTRKKKNKHISARAAARERPTWKVEQPNEAKTRAARKRKSVVRGSIRGADGTPRLGLTVRAFDRNIGKDDTLLGEATTDAQGNYRIAYASGQLDGKAAADLVITVYQDNSPLQTSDVIFNAPPDVVKDFTIAVDKGPEFQWLLNRIKPLMHSKIGDAGFSETQIGFLPRRHKPLR